jgi:uncharacterized protein YegL
MIFKKFLREDSGAIMPIFAVSLVPVIALIGASVDLAGATRAHNKLQVAVDSTALSVNHELHLSSVQTNIQTKAGAYFAVQAQGLENPELKPVSFSVADGRVDIVASAKYTPQLMRAVGFGPYTISAKARSVVGDQSIEVALVLDNSGSMEGTRLSNLKTAAKSLTNILFDSVNASTRIKISVVPFSGAVNVGATNASADWMDKNAQSPVHSENFVSAKNRFTLLTEMNTAWAGCVEARPDDTVNDVHHMTTDTVPTTLDPISLFVPMFAPDESDEPSLASNKKTFVNNYLSDDGSGNNCTNSDKSDTSNAGRQKRICKYKGRTPDTSAYGSTNKGPNFWCNSKPIVPLTNTKQTVIDSINAMAAKGYTNIHEGLMWGWRALSPTAPFTEGAAYDTPNLRKYIILMTDGANTINDRSTINKSDYSAYGYASKNRLDEDADDMDGGELKSAMDDRLEEACENAKNDDPHRPEKITIFTVAFHVTDEPTLTRLRECASGSNNAKVATSGTQLDDTFKAIAKDLGKLRLTQ